MTSPETEAQLAMLGDSYVKLVEEATRDDTALARCVAATTAALGEMIGSVAQAYGIDPNRYIAIAKRGVEIFAQAAIQNVSGSKH